MYRTLITLVSLAFAPLLFAQSADPVSLLPNGTFENVSAGTGRPADWPNAPFASWPIEDGNRFLRIQSVEPLKMHSLQVEVPVPADVRALELSFRARVTNLKKGEKPWHDARIIIDFQDAEGKRIGNAPPAYFAANTKGWQNRTTRFLVPKNVNTLVLMPALFEAQSGTFDLDDITLKPTDHVALEEQLARNAPPPVPPREQANVAKFPSEIRVVGNRLHDKTGREVWLQGVNVPSMEWNPRGENVFSSVVVAIEQWKGNVIRLPLKDKYWFGHDAAQEDGGKAYREMVDQVIVLAANRGVYVILDNHNYRAIRDEHITFWKDVAAKYGNHPAVLFDLINEPHGITWEVWRNGGFVAERKAKADEDNFITDEEKIAAKLGFKSPGMQKVLEELRSTGARNVVVAGALDYAYDLSGILKGFALEDKTGNGIMYASHIYPWKSDWQGKMLDVAAHHPILIGEIGADSKPQPWETPANYVTPESWLPDMLGLIKKHRLNWTGWSFHPKAGPAMLSDWRYTPSPYWGAWAKRALAGEQFELGRMR
ncbi:MAG: cellulase family glycosylhydrolase [Rariglobus sp.]